MNDMLSIKALCERASISRVTLHNLRRQGRGPVIHRIGRKVLISSQNAEAWIASFETNEHGSVVTKEVKHA